MIVKKLLIVGTVALDTLETPFGKKQDVLGGSAAHSAVAASFFSSTAIVSVIGKDFPAEHLKFLKSRNINIEGLRTLEGDTFRWSGYYEFDMNQAHTRDTKLNVLSSFNADLPEDLRDSEYVFLANLDPEQQLKIIKQLKKPKFIAADTMNLWIETKRKTLIELIKSVDFFFINDAEIRQLMETPNLPLAARRMMELGVEGLAIKKGEHGALLFNKNYHFSAPSYPQETFKDPTGAGDSFAGGFMGYLAKTDDISESNLRKAAIVGSVMASFNIEDFSMERMKRLQQREINERYAQFQKFVEFGCL
jgi:ribokinase